MDFKNTPDKLKNSILKDTDFWLEKFTSRIGKSWFSFLFKPWQPYRSRWPPSRKAASAKSKKIQENMKLRTIPPVSAELPCEAL